MRSILEQAFRALLNEEHDKAEELFHKFIVERARQIHESNRQGEDFELDENWDDEITTESYFTEEDLADLEDGEGDDGEASDGEDFEGADSFGGEAEGDEDGADEVSMDAEDGDGDEFAADADVEGNGAEEALEDKVDDLTAQIEKLTAEFEDMMAAFGDDDHDADADGEDFGGEPTDDFGAEGGEGEEGHDEALAGGLEDDMDGEEDAPMECMDEAEEYDDITESIIDELEKVSVTLSDGKEVGNGPSLTQNKSAAIPQKNKDARQGGAPIKMKQSTHKGFERETAPAVTDMKARRNTKKNAEAGRERVSKEGDKAAELNKLNSDGNNKSLL